MLQVIFELFVKYFLAVGKRFQTNNNYATWNLAGGVHI